LNSVTKTASENKFLVYATHLVHLRILQEFDRISYSNLPFSQLLLRFLLKKLLYIYLQYVCIYSPGQNKRNTLFSRLLFFSFIVWSHICTINTSLITQLILKVSALSNEKWSRKMQMYSMSSYTIVTKKANFGKIVLLSTNFFKTKYVFGISVKFWIKLGNFLPWKITFRFSPLLSMCKGITGSSKNFYHQILLNHASRPAEFPADSEYHIYFKFIARFSWY
jgi:hypothetical protein